MPRMHNQRGPGPHLRPFRGITNYVEPLLRWLTFLLIGIHHQTWEQPGPVCNLRHQTPCHRRIQPQPICHSRNLRRYSA